MWNIWEEIEIVVLRANHYREEPLMEGVLYLVSQVVTVFLFISSV